MIASLAMRLLGGGGGNVRCSVCTSASGDDKNISRVSISAFSVTGATSLLLFSAHSESPQEETGRIKGYRGRHRRRC